MLHMLRNSAAVLAATLTMTAPLMAQDAAPAPAAPATPEAAAPVTPAAPAATLPAALADLGITDVRLSERRKGGQRVDGSLPGGGAFRAMLDPQGQLRMIRLTDPTGALPEDIARRLLPEPIRTAPIFAEFARIEGLANHGERVMVFGADAQAQPVRAVFAPDGTLQRFGRGEMGGPRDGNRMKGKDGRKGPRDGKGDWMDSDWGPKAKVKMRGADGRAAPPDGMPGQPPAPLDDAAVQAILNDGGYTGIGAITRIGPRAEVEATNPEGEAVTVTVSPRGMVVRELAR